MGEFGDDDMVGDVDDVNTDDEFVAMQTARAPRKWNLREGAAGQPLQGRGRRNAQAVDQRRLRPRMHLDAKATCSGTKRACAQATLSI